MSISYDKAEMLRKTSEDLSMSAGVDAQGSNVGN
jgi:hypothetical protein